MNVYRVELKVNATMVFEVEAKSRQDAEDEAIGRAEACETPDEINVDEVEVLNVEKTGKVEE